MVFYLFEVKNMGISQAPVLFVQLVWILTAILLAFSIYYLIHIGNRFVPAKKVIKYNTKVILWTIISLFALYFIKGIFSRYQLVSDTFFTIIISIIIAYFLNPLVNYFQKRGFNRTLATGIVYLLILGVFVILFVLVLPRTGREIRRLATNLPAYITNLTTWSQTFYGRYTDTLGEMPELMVSIERIFSQNIDMIQSSIAASVEKFVLGIVGLFSRIISWILTPILTFYFLSDKDHFIERIKKLIPRNKEEEILALAREIDDALSSFIRGRLFMAVVVGIATTIFLFLVGVEFAIVIGFITGLADIIPYIGPFLGFLPAVVFAFISSPIKALWVGIFFILIQWAENNILAPKVLGKSTGIHPLTILLSIIVGGTIFGVMGMILSVPFVSVSLILYKYFKEKINQRIASKA